MLGDRVLLNVLYVGLVRNDHFADCRDRQIDEARFRFGNSGRGAHRLGSFFVLSLCSLCHNFFFFITLILIVTE